MFIDKVMFSDRAMFMDKVMFSDKTMFMGKVMFSDRVGIRNVDMLQSCL